MKIIDLLNKIANGEEDDLITEFEFDKRVWNFKGLNDSEFCLDGWLLNQNITITKHKEVLEEEKRIEQASLDTITNLQEEKDKYKNVIDKIKEKLNVLNEEPYNATTYIMIITEIYKLLEEVE